MPSIFLAHSENDLVFVIDVGSWFPSLMTSGKKLVFNSVITVGIFLFFICVFLTHEGRFEKHSVFQCVYLEVILKDLEEKL